MNPKTQNATELISSLAYDSSRFKMGKNMVHFKQEDLVYLERIKYQKIVRLLNWLKANFKMKRAFKGV